MRFGTEQWDQALRYNNRWTKIEDGGHDGRRRKKRWKKENRKETEKVSCEKEVRAGIIQLPGLNQPTQQN